MKEGDKEFLSRMLRRAGLRATKQRLGLAAHLFDGGRTRHITAEALHGRAGGLASLATVYNMLNQLTSAGLLRKLDLGFGPAQFDTNLEPHHHFYDEETGLLEDFTSAGVSVHGLPAAPRGKRVLRVDLVVHLSGSSRSKRRGVKGGLPPLKNQAGEAR